MQTTVGSPSISSRGCLGRSPKTHLGKRTARGTGDDDARGGGSAERAGRRSRLGVYGPTGEIGKVLASRCSTGSCVRRSAAISSSTDSFQEPIPSDGVSRCSTGSCVRRSAAISSSTDSFQVPIPSDGVSRSRIAVGTSGLQAVK